MKKLGKKFNLENETLESYGDCGGCSCFCWCTYYSHAEAYAEDYTNYIPDNNFVSVTGAWPGY